MPIEFRCSTCQKLLRVKDESAGKKAKCPECGALLEIPAAGAAAAPPPMPASSIENDNPFASPIAHDTGQNASEPVAGGEINPTRIDVGDVFSKAWAIFKDQMGMVIAVVVVVMLINMVGSGLVQYIGGQAGGIVFVVLQLAYSLFSTFLGIGQAMIMLDVARGRQASFDKLFAGGPFFLNVFVAAIIMTICVWIGLILLIIPGIIVSLMLSQFYWLIIDKNVGIMDSLSLSRKITDGNKLTLFVIGLVSFGIALLGALACGIGLFIAIPYLMVVMPVAYLKMTGQPVAGDA